MKNKIAKIRKHFDDHRTYYAFCAGSITTSGIIYLLTKDKTILEVSKDQLEMMKQGGAVVYKLKDQTVHLVNIAAVEAQQNL